LPRIDDGGNIHCFSGYDAVTGLYNDQPIQLDIPDRISLAEARQFKERLFSPWSKFKFKDQQVGVANTLALIFTAMERAYLDLAPTYVVSSPDAGSGKGKLIRAVMWLMLATRPPKITWGGDKEEIEKTLTAILVQTPSAFVVDNANGILIKGRMIESIITEGYANIRPFGSNTDTIMVILRALMIINGNNPLISGDMARRALRIDINPGANPEQARFDFDPVVQAQQHRKELLEAAFAIMKAFRQAGMPEFGLRAVGSFGDWERRVRNLVYWLTDYDVAIGFDMNKKKDPLRQNDAALVEALYTYFFDNVEAEQSKLFTSADVMGIYEEVKFRHNRAPLAVGVHDALAQVFGDKKIDAKTFGYWPSRMNDVHCDSFVLNLSTDTATNSRVSAITCSDPEKRAAVAKAIEAARAAETARAPDMFTAAVEVEVARRLAAMKKAPAE
jgi:hypothetical protein